MKGQLQKAWPEDRQPYCRIEPSISWWIPIYPEVFIAGAYFSHYSKEKVMNLRNKVKSYQKLSQSVQGYYFAMVSY